MTKSTFMDLALHVSHKSGIRIFIDEGELLYSYSLDCRVRNMLSTNYCAFYISPDVERGLEQIVINMNHNLCALSYFRVLMHELAHATGRSDIFARPGVANQKPYHYNSRVEEELIADTAAMLLVREFGLSNPEIEAHHTNYIKNHIECLAYSGTAPSPYIGYWAAQAATYIRDNWLTNFNMGDV